MTRTPEEIKKGIECCYAMDCNCLKRGCPYIGMRLCHDHVLKDARDYILKLEADVKIGQIKLEEAFAKCSQLEAERCRLIDTIRVYGGCEFCLHSDCDMSQEPCLYCVDNERWEWSGVQKEDGNA